MSRFLITGKLPGLPFFTDNFDSKNHFVKHIDMIVYDLFEEEYTINGEVWSEIKTDHL